MIRAAVTYAFVFAIGACAPPPPTALEIADRTTHAVYDNDAPAIRGLFDPGLRRTITSASVGHLALRMHYFGDYQRIQPLAAAPRERRYVFKAYFDRGSMLVQLRLDPNGRVAAYRVVPMQTPTPRPSTELSTRSS